MGAEIDHLGIAVRSLDEALSFYAAGLGMEAGARERVEQERVIAIMLPTGAGGPRIELLEGMDGESVITKFVEKRGPGLHHVALRVDNLAEVADRLKSQGAKLLNEPRRGVGGHTYVFVHPSSAAGVLLELIQK